jgi:hypothetical protein
LQNINLPLVPLQGKFLFSDGMIIARPNPQTLFSFSIFALSSAALIVWNASVYFLSPLPKWYNLGIIALLAPILGYVLYRLFFQLKRIEIGNNQFVIHYLFYRKMTTYPIDQIKQWTEHTVKVGKKATYKELEITFTSHIKITLGKKEYTEYEKIVSYLKKKLARKEVAQ